MAADVVLHDTGLRHLIREISKVSQNELSHFEVETVVENAIQHALNLKSKHPFEKQYILSQLKKIQTYEQLVKFNNLFKRKAQQQTKQEKYGSGHTLRQINARLEILDLFGQRLSKQLIKNIRQFQQHMNMQFAENYCYEAKKYVQNLQRDFYLQTSKTIKSPQQIQQLCDILLNISDDVGLLRFFFEKFEQNIAFYKQQSSNYNVYDKIHKQQLEELKQKELQIGKAVSEAEWNEMKKKSVINYSFDDQYALNQIDRLINNKIFLFSERTLAIEIIQQLREINNFEKQQNHIRNYMRKHSQATYINYLLQLVLKKVLYVNYFINYYQFLCDFDGTKTLKQYEKYDIVQNAINKQNEMVSKLERSQRQRFFQYVDGINNKSYSEDSDIIKQPKPPYPDEGYENSIAHQEFTQNVTQMAKNIANQDWRVQLENKQQVAVNAYNAQTMRMSELALLQTKLTDKFNREALSQYQNFTIGEFNQQTSYINQPQQQNHQHTSQHLIQPYQQFVPQQQVMYTQSQVQSSLNQQSQQLIQQPMLVYGDSNVYQQQSLFKTPHPYSEIEASNTQQEQNRGTTQRDDWKTEDNQLNDIIIASQSIHETTDQHNTIVNVSRSVQSLKSDGSEMQLQNNQNQNSIQQQSTSQSRHQYIPASQSNLSMSFQQQAPNIDQNMQMQNSQSQNQSDQIARSSVNELNVQTITITAPIRYNKIIKKEKLEVELEQAIAVKEKLLEMRDVLKKRVDVGEQQLETLLQKYQTQIQHQQAEFNNIVKYMIEQRLKQLNIFASIVKSQLQRCGDIEERFINREQKQQQIKFNQIQKKYKPVIERTNELILLIEKGELPQYVQRHHYALMKYKQKTFEIQKKMAKLNVLRFNRLIYGFMAQKREQIRQIMDKKLNNVQIFVENEYKLHNLRDHYERLLLWFKEDKTQSLNELAQRYENVQQCFRLHKKRKDIIEILVLKQKRFVQTIKLKQLIH